MELKNLPAACLRILAPVALLLLGGAAQAADTVRVDRDDVEIRSSCTIEVVIPSIRDENANGVIRIVGRDDGERIVVDLGGGKLGDETIAPSARAGIGISISGRNVTLRNGRVVGFKVGVSASDCDGLVIEDLDTSDNYAQALLSKPWEENAADWLYPHRNDAGEWAAQHGAGVSVRNAKGVTLRRITNLRTQNGILLDRVADSAIYDNECSFLSGWGIAMWRSSGNKVCRNSLDFCVRGYSHGVYNRGQDSAGLLMFEQCSDNVVALNSMTHCGDGVFGFAGREALGESAAPAGSAADFHKGRGSNRNLFVGNDLSHSAAHGLEMTFSFGNRIIGNRFDDNAICGIWGGYSRDTIIAENTFSANGGAPYGAERGGINIEHGQRNTIVRNTFSDEPAGVRIWSDEDAGLRRLPWAAANGADAKDNVIAGNAFARNNTAIELVGASGTAMSGNTFEGCIEKLVAKDSPGTTESAPSTDVPTLASLQPMLDGLPGTRKAVGMRADLNGRDRIVMLDQGPFDWVKPVVVNINRNQARPKFRIYGINEADSVSVIGNGQMFIGLEADKLTSEVATNTPGFLTHFNVQMIAKSRLSKGIGKGVIVAAEWRTRVFNLDADGLQIGKVPTEAEFRARAAEAPMTLVLKTMDFDFGMEGPEEAIPDPNVEGLGVGRERFGLATDARMAVRPGRWRMTVESDDGMRAYIDGRKVLDRWDVHTSAVDSYEFEVEEVKDMDFAFEYFEDSGPAKFRVRFEYLGPPAKR
ncbi:MAG: right-handed parallel beta-helix repeat-containing protein [Planctomycetaceae bacterium]|nr:right-handed parallel beta-helix repeat-containing protein [Planctomycetaceae bacterium]